MGVRFVCLSSAGDRRNRPRRSVWPGAPDRVTKNNLKMEADVILRTWLSPLEYDKRHYQELLALGMATVRPLPTLHRSTLFLTWGEGWPAKLEWPPLYESFVSLDLDMY